MIATGRACWLLQQHLRFVDCERDQNCVVEGIPSLARTFARQLLNKDSDLMASEDVLNAAHPLVDALDGIVAKKRADVSAVSKWLAAVQTFSKHVLPIILMSLY